MNATKDVWVIGGNRTPFTKSFTHYKNVTNQELMTNALEGLVNRYNLQGKYVDDLAFGSVMLSSKDWNLSREVVLGSSLDHKSPAYNVQRACGTGLETINHMAMKIATGQINVGIAGGSDTNSDLPIMGSARLSKWLVELKEAKSMTERLKVLTNFRPQYLKPVLPAVKEPRTGLSMGEHCELMVKEWGITRLEQDQLAFQSHQNAHQAYEEGFYNDLVTPLEGLNKDALIRGSSTLDKMAKLKPAFDKSEKGTLTAANSTPLTDGASCVLLASEEYAKANALTPLARFKDAQVAGLDFVAGDGLLMAPAVAVGQLLKRNNLTFADFDFFEIHEAFAGQVLCTLKAWEDDKFCQEKIGLDKALGSIDRSKMNVKGGSVALGHPFAATGGRIVAGLAKLIHQKGSGRGLISICTAGGMGVAAIIER